MDKHLEMVQNLVDKIEKNVSYDVNITTLANSFDLSPWHFQRLFKSIVGDSLGSYTRGRRLSLAATLLQTTQLSIIDIAFEVGFTSHESFSRSFKNYFKFSPKDFRENKPKVLINKKPLLTNNLLEHITTGMNKEPIIIDKPEQIIVGLELKVPNIISLNSNISLSENLCEHVTPYWLELFDKEKEIMNRSEGYCGVIISSSGNFIEETLNYIAGVPVSFLDKLPKGMKTYTIPKQKVAIFELQSELNSQSVKKTIDYIYGYWLPSSAYKRAVGADYELFTDVVNAKTGEFKMRYVIPII